MDSGTLDKATKMQERTKLVIRKLPPTLSTEAFQESIGKAWFARSTWFAYTQGKVGHKRIVHSRAYINLKTDEEVIEFCDFFQNHLFVNERGNQFRAQIEYAPSQKVPKSRQRRDPREATIEKDPEYLKFVEDLSKPEEYLPSAELQLEKRDAEGKAALLANNGIAPVIVTPLMAFLKQKSEDKRNRLSQKFGARTAVAIRAVSSGRAGTDRDRRSRSEKNPNHEQQKASSNHPPQDARTHATVTTVLVRPQSTRSTASVDTHHDHKQQSSVSYVKPKAVAVAKSQESYGSGTPKDRPTGNSGGRNRSGREQATRESKQQAGLRRAGGSSDTTGGPGGNDTAQASGIALSTKSAANAAGSTGGASKRRDAGAATGAKGSSKGDPSSDRGKTQPPLFQPSKSASGINTHVTEVHVQHVDKQLNTGGASSRQRQQQGQGGAETLDPRRPLSGGGSGAGRGAKENNQGSGTQETGLSAAASKPNRSRPDRQIYTPRPRGQPADG
mmetsp:Transcript_8355/g.14391  ORF Transcript_8355/g.14391 Transcript_8355/m.14391 type:complete len:501 (+) Transcript_8355:105-1607(+)